jgi:hypothetical protein
VFLLLLFFTRLDLLLLFGFLLLALTRLDVLEFCMINDLPERCLMFLKEKSRGGASKEM